jgi:hypothetical protein
MNDQQKMFEKKSNFELKTQQSEIAHLTGRGLWF